ILSRTEWIQSLLRRSPIFTNCRLVGRDPLSYDDPLRQITRMIQKFPKPIISMVEGSVWGGAFEMIMSSDLIIAASTSTFSMTPVNLGVPYNLVGIHNLTRDAGFHIVKELIFYRFANHRPARAGCRHPQPCCGSGRTGRFH
ncbi:MULTISPECIES: enoyl-CoA hydratase-related protein, partial [unclassified Staphylococcus]|uniref:enoyl-CoA hydratase-related protein n=1 Tax=unclassified Staphylococcus TaxID=91994 RepID=UPI001A4F033E